MYGRPPALRDRGPERVGVDAVRLTASRGSGEVVREQERGGRVVVVVMMMRMMCGCGGDGDGRCLVLVHGE